jgi:hypothetical protein
MARSPFGGFVYKRENHGFSIAPIKSGFKAVCAAFRSFAAYQVDKSLLLASAACENSFDGYFNGFLCSHKLVSFPANKYAC